MTASPWVAHRAKWRAQDVCGLDARQHCDHKAPGSAAAGPSAAEGRPRSLWGESSEFSLAHYLATLCPASFLSPLYIRSVWLLCKAVRVLAEVCSEQEKWCGTYLDNSWRPSSRRWEHRLSLAPSDAMKKWASLNRVTWSSVWGCVIWNSSRQRSFTHTPDPTHTRIWLQRSQ